MEITFSYKNNSVTIFSVAYAGGKGDTPPHGKKKRKGKMEKKEGERGKRRKMRKEKKKERKMT